MRQKRWSSCVNPTRRLAQGQAKSSRKLAFSLLFSLPIWLQAKSLLSGPTYPSFSMGLSQVLSFLTTRKARCALNPRDFKEGAEDAARLNSFVEAMPLRIRHITQLWFGLGDGYSYSLTEIAAIFKSDAFEIDERITEIEHQLEQAGLLVIARRQLRT